MPDWQEVIRASHHEPLDAQQVAEIRRAAIAAATLAAGRPAAPQARAMLITAVLISAVTGALFVAASSPAPRPSGSVTGTASPATVKQLQFATPGGTRIIWHFNPAFSLSEPLR